jgi:hypothetical protein
VTEFSPFVALFTLYGQLRRFHTIIFKMIF